MHAPLFSSGIRVVALVVANLTMLQANAQGLSSGASQPGWLVSVGKAQSNLDAAPPPNEIAATFAVPASGFDLASYRGSVQNALPYGLAYDAEGELNVSAAGQYKFRVTASWDAADADKTGTCAVLFSVAGVRVADWKGPVGAESGQKVVEASPILRETGPQTATLHVACDQPQGARFRVELTLQGPGDSDLRPPGLQDITHGTAAVTAAIQSPPPPAQAQPAPPQPSSPQPLPPQAAPTAAQRLVATIDIKVRAEPNAGARTLRRLKAGESVDVVGPAADPAWYQLAEGGYALAGFLKPAGAAGPERPGSAGAQRTVHHASTHRYKVGDCAPYRAQANVDNAPGAVEGRACLQADGHWRIVQ